MQPTAAQQSLFEGERVARLATADANGKPHCVPVVFLWTGERFLIPLDEKPKRVAVARLKRVRNIAANPQVALLFDHYEEDWSQLTFLMVEGTATLTHASEQSREAFARKYPQYREVAIHGLISIQPVACVQWRAKGAF